jgi:hypothetical protein
MELRSLRAAIDILVYPTGLVLVSTLNYQLTNSRDYQIARSGHSARSTKKSEFLVMARRPYHTLTRLRRVQKCWCWS